MSAETALRFLERTRRLGPDECWLWQGPRDGHGYGRLFADGRTWIASRYALTLALGRELEPGELACHRCDNPPCVNPAHLFVGTHADNHADRNRKNRQAKGARHGRCKLTEEQVYEIRRLYDEEGLRVRQISRLFGVSHGPIGHIVRRTQWSWLPERDRRPA